MPGTHRPLAERLWSRLTPTTSGCWEWQGTRLPHGYGSIGLGPALAGKGRTHRVAWELTHGPIPAGLLVRHKCDNPPCCNPDHLELGTPAENARDRVERGRQPRGETSCAAKITQVIADEIRREVSAGALHREVAAVYGISASHVSRIMLGLHWVRPLTPTEKDAP